MKRLLTVVFVILIFQSCNTQKLSSGDFQRQWMLVSFQNYSKAYLAENSANLDLSATKSPANQYRVYTGCSQMFLNAKFYQNGKVEFSEVGRIKKTCKTGMNLDADFAKVLPTMVAYKIEGHKMILSDNRGNEMKFVAADWD